MTYSMVVIGRKGQIFLVLLIICNIVYSKKINLSKQIFNIIKEPTNSRYPKTQQRNNVVKISVINNTQKAYSRKIRTDIPNVYKLPLPSMDSYMKAYHESHKKKNYNLELKDIMHTMTNPFKELDKKQFNDLEAIHYAKEEKSPINYKQETEILKITKDDRIGNNLKHNNLFEFYKNKAEMNKNAESIFDGEGVSIKPHGVIGISTNNNFVEQKSAEQQTNQLYTGAIQSYEKPYSQAKDTYHDTNPINSLHYKHEGSPFLTSLFHTSVQASQDAANSGESLKDMPLYTKAISSTTPPYINYDQINYYPQFNAVEDQVKDEIPTEKPVQDLIQPFKTVINSQSVEQISDNMPAMVQNNYYKVEVASQTISENPFGQEVYANVASLPSTNEVYHNQGVVLKNTVNQLHQEETGLSPYKEENLTYAASYEFGYRVRDPHTGNDFGHQELKDGEETEGHYHVLLPDGRLQNVKYWAGPAGYHAQISYHGGEEN